MIHRVRRPLALGIVAFLGLAPGAAAQQADSVASAYAELLARWADGEEEEALRRLTGLEWQLLQSGDGPGRVREAQLDFVEELRPWDPRVIPPIIALHESAYQAYRAEGAMEHTVWARVTMTELCEQLAKRAITPDTRQLAGDLFATLGTYAAESSSGPIVMALHQRALELDSSNEAALLGAAMYLEERGRFNKALPLLERLYRDYPANVEGQLRLAIHLDRAGRSVEAMGLLEALRGSQAPWWILSLAHQMLARLHLDADSPDRARAVLADGVARYPEDPTLALALAYAEERAATDGSPPELSPRLAPNDRLSDRPPRFLYARQQPEVFARLRARALRDANAYRSVLAKALAERAMPVPEGS